MTWISRIGFVFDLLSITSMRTSQSKTNLRRRALCLKIGRPKSQTLGWWNGRHVRLRGVCRKACGFKSRPEHQSKVSILASKVSSLLTGWPEFQLRKFAEGGGELGPPRLRFQNRDDFVGVGVFCAAIILRASDSLSANHQAASPLASSDDAPRHPFRLCLRGAPSKPVGTHCRSWLLRCCAHTLPLGTLRR
jgi:hypothetical protein